MSNYCNCAWHNEIYSMHENVIYKRSVTESHPALCLFKMYSALVRACAVIAFLILSPNCARALQDHAKDNGDIFIINYDSFDGDVDDISTTTSAPREADYVDFDEVNRNCNASFITSMSECKG